MTYKKKHNIVTLSQKKMNDNEINRLIETYQIDPQIKIRNQIINQYYPIVHAFPSYIKHNRDEDFAADFTAAFIEKADILLRSYQSKASSFLTYLTAALNNLYNDLLRRKMTMQSYQEPEKSISALEETEASYNAPVCSEDARRMRIMQVINKYRGISWLAIKCVYFDFFDEEDFLKMPAITGKPYSECLSFIDRLSDEIAEKRSKLLHKEDQLSRIYVRIMKIHSLLARSTGPDETSLRSRLESYEKTRRCYLDAYFKLRTAPAYRLIAGFLGTSEKKIQQIVFLFKRRLASCLKKNTRRSEDIYG
ncbi:MAG TPA: hypothetical protein DC049_16445 [Spirochaetia bacterium]|nr:hypothetical protein [Spirochaetia bacterium]